MKIFWACWGLVIGFMLGNCTGAQAAPMACSPRADVLQQLSTKFKEQPISIGLANNGGLLEVLSSEDGSSWTIIITTPNGISCLVAAGEDWQPIEPDFPAPDSLPL